MDAPLNLRLAELRANATAAETTAAAVRSQLAGGPIALRMPDGEPAAGERLATSFAVLEAAAAQARAAVARFERSLERRA